MGIKSAVEQVEALLFTCESLARRKVRTFERRKTSNPTNYYIQRLTDRIINLAGYFIDLTTAKPYRQKDIINRFPNLFRNPSKFTRQDIDTWQSEAIECLTATYGVIHATGRIGYEYESGVHHIEESDKVYIGNIIGTYNSATFGIKYASGLPDLYGYDAMDYSYYFPGNHNYLTSIRVQLFNPKIFDCAVIKWIDPPLGERKGYIDEATEEYSEQATASDDGRYYSRQSSTLRKTVNGQTYYLREITYTANRQTGTRVENREEYEVACDYSEVRILDTYNDTHNYNVSQSNGLESFENSHSSTYKRADFGFGAEGQLEIGTIPAHECISIYFSISYPTAAPDCIEARGSHMQFFLDYRQALAAIITPTEQETDND